VGVIISNSLPGRFLPRVSSASDRKLLNTASRRPLRASVGPGYPSERFDGIDGGLGLGDSPGDCRIDLSRTTAGTPSILPISRLYQARSSRLCGGQRIPHFRTSFRAASPVSCNGGNRDRLPASGMGSFPTAGRSPWSFGVDPAAHHCGRKKKKKKKKKKRILSRLSCTNLLEAAPPSGSSPALPVPARPFGRWVEPSPAALASARN